MMAGMGFDAHMLDATSETAKARIGWPAYVLGALKHLKDRPLRVTIRIDDGEPMRRRARSVLIANVGRLQGGVRLLSEAEPDDGVLDVAVLTPRTLRNWAALGWGLIRRTNRVPSMEVFRGAKVEVISNRRQPRSTRRRPDRHRRPAGRRGHPRRLLAVRTATRRGRRPRRGRPRRHTPRSTLPCRREVGNEPPWKAGGRRLEGRGVLRRTGFGGRPD